MEYYLYFSLYPESLIASMLSPEQFGNYLAVGTKKRESQQEALYFQVDPEKCKGIFNLTDIDTRVVAHKDGEPKHSVYYSIYRVLEKLPLDAIKDMYLATRYGRVLRLEKTNDLPQFNDKCYLYQEIVPVHPRIASSLDPVKFSKFITDRNNRLYVPKICFVDLRLGDLANDPENGSVYDLPYPQIDYLKECLKQVKNNEEKHTKTVNRIQSGKFIYRVINNGFYVAEGSKLLFIKFPSEKELNSTYYHWWKSATHH
ncbi:MAG: hypothetical protein JW969_11680 [Spirochaetales bacterium]|nr:hypothetical protein [Spirochaetales bacterium]